MSNVMKIDVEEERFARFRLISWWDQQKLADARVLVIGMGAIGNEILKNLALLGIGNVFIADLDNVELSNLSRSVLFRAEDRGRSKVEAAAGRAREIFPEMKIQPFQGNIVYDLGLGVYRWADIILGGLDNREARVAINQSAARMGKLWIDGAIERLDGVARVFDPATGPCYECTMNETDWKMLEMRRSCALLTRKDMEEGKVPTTPTTSSIIAAIQCQEAVKYLHGLDYLTGQGFVFEGTYHQSYLVSYSRREECMAHEPYDPIEQLHRSVNDTKAGELLEIARSKLGRTAVIETNQDLLAGLLCEKCNHTEDVNLSLGKVTEDRGRCPKCGEHRTPKMYHTIEENSGAILDKTLAELGVSPWDILGARCGDEICYFELDADKPQVLGGLK